jgi:hypothetical protein
MDQATYDLRMERQIERRAAKARTGLCLGCGTFQLELLPGRTGGYCVYCPACAAIPRDAAKLEGARNVEVE